MDTVFAILLILFGVAFYSLPAIIAQSDCKRNVGTIFVLNLFFGLDGHRVGHRARVGRYQGHTAARHCRSEPTRRCDSE
jgi:hypothetical protein